MDESLPAIARVVIQQCSSRCHRFVAADTLLGELHMDPSPSATFVDARGRRARLGWASLWRHEYKLWRGGVECAAAQVDFQSGRIDIQVKTQRFLLQSLGSDAYTWRLTDVAEQPRLTVTQRALGDAAIDVHTPVSLDLLVLAYYLAVVGLRTHQQA